MSSLSLNEGGYDYKFIEEPADSLKCLICLLVVREPQQHGGCGKLFCKVCINKHKLLRNDCPHCRQPLKNSNAFQPSSMISEVSGWTIMRIINCKSKLYQCFTINLITPLNPKTLHTNTGDQEVKSLMVDCSTACGWKGELGSLDNHKQKDCENTIVFCENNCGAIILRNNLTAHLESKCPNRLHKCPDCGANNKYKNHQVHTKLHCPKRSHSCVHCGEKGCFDERTSTHLELCPKMKIACKKCTQLILRCQLPIHLIKECTFEPVPCKYAKVGCKVRPLRKDLKKHEENYQLHLQVTTNKVLELTEMLPKPVSPVTFRVTDFDKHKKANDIVYGPPFYTSINGYKMCLRIDSNGNGTSKGTHVSVFTCLLPGEYDDYLTWPCTGTVTIEILNQLENQNHYQKSFKMPADKYSERVLDSERRGSRGYPAFISHRDLLANQFPCQYLKNDTLIFRVSVLEAPDYKPWLECIN